MESTAVQTSSEEWTEGTCDARLYDELSTYVATPAFLKAFEQQSGSSSGKPQHPLLKPHSRDSSSSAPSPAGNPGQQHGTSSVAGTNNTSSAAAADAGSSSSANGEAQVHATPAVSEAGGNSSSDVETQQQQQPEASYVFVQQEDAVQAMAFYLAQCIAAHPEAQKLAPKQLQDALSNTLQGLKQTRFKQMCTYGRSAYRWSALTYSALQMYQNPWLIRAILTTIWAFSKLGMRAFV